MKTAANWILQLVIVAVLGYGAFVFFTKTNTDEGVEQAAPNTEEATLNLPVEILHPMAITPEYTSLAKVEEWQSSGLGTTASGRVVWVCECYEEGQVVEAGTRLLQIDTSLYKRDVINREKDLVNARTKAVQAEAEVTLARENYARLDLGAPSDIALKLPELEVARLAVDAAEAALSIARDQLAETDITAPFSGIISNAGVSVGDLVNNGANLGTLVGTETFRVRFPILENQLSLVNIGTEIHIETTTRPMIEKVGIVKAIDIDIDQTTRLNSVIVAVQSPLEGEVLRIGRFVNGTFVGTPIVDVFALPIIALDNEMYYYQLDQDNRLLRIKATPLYRDFRAVYIAADGLESLSIVTENVLGLRAGMLVQGYER